MCSQRIAFCARCGCCPCVSHRPQKPGCSILPLFHSLSARACPLPWTLEATAFHCIPLRLSCTTAATAHTCTLLFSFIYLFSAQSLQPGLKTVSSPLLFSTTRELDTSVNFAGVLCSSPTRCVRVCAPHTPSMTPLPSTQRYCSNNETRATRLARAAQRRRRR